MAALNADIPAMLESAEEEESKMDTNMWEDLPEAQEKEVRYEGESRTIVAASLNRLIEALTSLENYGIFASFSSSGG